MNPKDLLRTAGYLPEKAPSGHAPEVLRRLQEHPCRDCGQSVISGIVLCRDCYEAELLQDAHSFADFQN